MTRWLFWVAYNWAFVALLLWCAVLYPWLSPLFALAIGTRQHALLVLGHDAVHDTPRVGIWSVWLGRVLCFWPMFACFDGYRAMHGKHHAYLGTHRDPEVEHRLKWGGMWTNLTPKKKVALLVQDIFGANARYAIDMLLWIDSGYTWVRALVVFGFLGALLAVEWWLPLLWAWAILTALAAIMRLRMWTEHWDQGVGGTRVWDAKWWQRWIYAPHSTWHHKAHHDSPRIPFWDLSKHVAK